MQKTMQHDKTACITCEAGWQVSMLALQWTPLLTESKQRWLNHTLTTP